MISDLNLSAIPKKIFDYCIVGAGPAGITLAINLAKQKKTVLLAEGGGLNWQRDASRTLQGQVIGDEYFSLENSRLKLFGGTSGHWTGMCRPLDDLDFKFLDNHWPITKKDLEPFLEESCKILEIPNKFEDRLLSSTHGIKSIDFQFSPPVRFGSKYFKAIKESENIYVSLNSNLVNLEFNNKTIKTACFKSFNKRSAYVNAGKFILTTGGIENSRLLKWINKVNNFNLLPKNTPIGNYWMEHPHYKVGEALVDRRWADKYISLSSDIRKNFGIYNAGIRFEQLGDQGSVALIKDLMCVAPVTGKRIAKLFEKNLVCAGTIRSAWEQEPLHTNRVELSLDKKDIFGIPNTMLYWKKSENDFYTIQKTMFLINNWIMNQGHGRLKLDAWITNKEQYPKYDELGGIGYHHIGGYHHMGGTRMGNNHYDGVVDKNLKIFGKDNLFICGSSVFPSSGHANPTLTIIQLSLRLAEHLS